MRTHEPCLSVTPSADSSVLADGETRKNFSNDALSREEKIAELFKPRIRHGYRAGKGWSYGVWIAGQAYFSATPEPLMARVQAYWAAFWDSTPASDFNFALAIADQMREAGVDWPVS